MKYDNFFLQFCLILSIFLSRLFKIEENEIVSIQNSKIFLKPCSVKLETKDVKYDLISFSSYQVNFLINISVFRDLVFIRGQQLFYFCHAICNVYWRVAFKEEIE